MLAVQASNSKSLTKSTTYLKNSVVPAIWHTLNRLPTMYSLRNVEMLFPKDHQLAATGDQCYLLLQKIGWENRSSNSTKVNKFCWISSREVERERSFPNDILGFPNFPSFPRHIHVSILPKHTLCNFPRGDKHSQLIQNRYISEKNLSLFFVYSTTKNWI